MGQKLLSFPESPPAPVRTAGELWTSRQRQKHSLHYVLSYRASFKPELPEFFIERYSEPGDVVLDPFCGRGTTLLQANLMGRVGWGNDSNPLATRVTRAKCRPVTLEQIERRLEQIPLDAARDAAADADEPDLSMFYAPETFRELLNLRDWLRDHRTDVDRFIELVALSRLHGHSTGFFSVYSFPQISVPAERQRRINEKREQTPEHRPLAPRIFRKAKKALEDADVPALRAAAKHNRLFNGDSRRIRADDGSVHLIVTSPPFLDKADYVTDNWLELWFLGIDAAPLRTAITQLPNLDAWRDFMLDVMREMERLLVPGGVAVIEVGEVVNRSKVVNLDEVLCDIADELWRGGHRLHAEEVLIQEQSFTKLANCFSVTNNEKGTNTQRMVVLRKA